MDPQQRIDLFPACRAVIDIVQGIIFSIITCGIYSLYWQYRQMETLNAWQEEEDYSFFTYLALSIITCGIYAIYMEYKMSQTINRIQHTYELPVKTDLSTICVLLSVFVTPIASLAIQQAEINQWYDVY